jgi:hypothetical protein
MESRSATHRGRSVLVVLSVGLALAAGSVIVVLSRSPLTVVGTNSIPAHRAVAYAKGGFSKCQPSGTLPAGTSAIRISASANTGPRVRLRVLSGGRLVTSGEREAGWGVDETVTIPVNTVTHAIPGVNICIAFGPVIEETQLNGVLVNAAAAGGGTVSVAMLRFEYLRPSHSSWWSLASSVARRMGLGHAPSGTWVVFLLMGIMIVVAVLATRLILRELR